MKPKKQDRQESERAQRIGNPMCPRLMPLKKAAEYIGLTVWGLREAVWRGDIPVVTFPGGRKQFIDSADIETFIQRNKRTIN